VAAMTLASGVGQVVTIGGAASGFGTMTRA